MTRRAPAATGWRSPFGVVRVLAALPALTLLAASAVTGAAPSAAPSALSAPAPVGVPARSRSAAGDVSIRVGLASDLERFALACCGGRVELSVDGETLFVEAPFTIEPAAESVDAPEHRLQVAALKDERQARELALDLAGKTDWPADVGFDAASGLYRVRLGRFGAREEAEAARDRVAALGLGGVWVTQEGGALERPALRVITGERSFRVLGRWVSIRPPEDGGVLEVPVEAQDVGSARRSARGRYRGRLLLFLNDRGTLNLINELPLEQYLRGVVPKELGPELYPRLEALKAQTVAARTYALRHLGEFGTEGFDLCSGVRCQVYGGADAEHPLSDRAIEETAGEVLLWGDELIEAYYSATCGGHTEDGRVSFPWMDAPYLKGVPCPEAGAVRLAGGLPPGTPFPGGLTRLVIPPPEGSDREQLEGRLRSLAKTAGLPLPDDRLSSLERSEVRRYVRSLFDLVLDPSLLADDRVGAVGADQSGDGGGFRLAAWTSETARGDGGAVRSGEAEWLVFSLARLVGLLDHETVRFRALVSGSQGSVLSVQPVGDGAHGVVAPMEVPLGSGSGLPATFRRPPGAADREPVAADLELAPGDRLTLYRWRGVPRAVVQDAPASGGGSAVRQARLHTWTRFRSDSRLAELVGERFPGLGFTGLEVLSRGVSGRVGSLRLLGEGGRSATVEGLAVRWTLDLPDTRFEMERVERAGGEPGWLFTGGGWGHGVGMCQVGAYGMAGRGLGYREILGYYYTGVHLGRVVVK